MLEVAYLSDVVGAYDSKVFRVLAQWIFVGLNRHDNHIIENLYLRSYNADAANIVDQIKNATFPKDSIVSGLSNKVIISIKWRRMLDAKKTIETMFSERDDVAERPVSSRNEQLTATELQLEPGSDYVGTREGVARCIENEIRALEKSNKHPERSVFPWQ